MSRSLSVAVEPRPRSSEVVPLGELVRSLEQKSIECLAAKNMSLQARYVYGIIFLLINLCAWFIRDYGQRMLPHLHFFKACGNKGEKCFETLGVLRQTQIFFFLMFLTTLNTSKLYEVRNTWHSKWWALKFLLLVFSMVVTFFVTSDFIQLYGELARVGAGVFLVLQLVSVIEFITWWNNYWMPDENRKQSCYLGLFMSTVFYIASVFGIGLMFYLYTPNIECALNIFFVTWTAVLLVVMMAISLHSLVNRGLLSSGIMASYLVFLCWSAIRSEPVNDKCNPHKQAHGISEWTTILGFLIAIGAIVMATFSTGIDSQSFQFKQDKAKSEDDIPYDYGFFHLVFSLGAMYFAMLFISWNLENSPRKWSIDVGWTSTWVKIVNEWFAATIYLWKLLSPIVRQPKVAGHETNNHVGP
ncbi:hypothetical protein ACFE04_008875 [Oxalis oulophora]